MTFEDSSKISDCQEHEPSADQLTLEPVISKSDLEILERATLIPGSHYGVRMSSNAALWALAIQRTAFEQHVSYLTACNEQRLRSAKWAAVIAAFFGTIAFGGTLIFDRIHNPALKAVANSVIREPKTANTHVVQSSPQMNSSVDNGDVRKPAVPVVSRAVQSAPRRWPERSAVAPVPAPAPAETQHTNLAVKASAWIAEPLRGEALRQALIVDRERTKELNKAELQR